MTTGTQTTIGWSALLTDAVNKPGVISAAYSVFHNYSVGNQLLAWSQCLARGVELSPIATYKKWKTLGRQVKRGEKAIHLVMPVTINKKDDAGEKTGDVFQFFMLKNNWFLLSQTEGDDFANEVYTAAWAKDLALPALNITEVTFTQANGNCQGYATGRNIAINPVAALPHKTRFHELAHVVLGHTLEHTMTDSEHTPRDTREVEAESVAYILCSILGLPGLEESRGYIQNWLAGGEITDKSAQRIFGAAEKILKAGQAAAADAE
jgi:antirestriction protein ArdC